MTMDSATQEKPDIIRDAKELEKVLGELETTLTRQLQLASEEQYDTFIEAGETTAGILERVTHAEAPITAGGFDTIKRIHAIHNRLGLLLASRSDEMAEKLAQMRSGKNVHRAYRDAAGT